MRPGGRGRSLGRRRRRREAGAPWGPVRVYTAAGGCGRGTRRGGGTMVMAHFVENFWVSGGCWERRSLRLPLRGLRARRAAAPQAAERESTARGCSAELPRATALRPPRPPGRQLRGAPELAARPGSRGGDSEGLRRRVGTKRRRGVRGVGRGEPGTRPVCFPRRRPGAPRRVGARPDGLGTSSRPRGWASGAAPRTLPPGLLTKPVQVEFRGPSSFSPH